MKKMFKRVLSLLIATATCLSMGLSAFAAEDTTKTTADNGLVWENDDWAEDGEIMPRGTIAGYAYAVISPTKNYITIPCSSSVASGEVSGMGITIQTRCSQTFVVGYRGYANDYKASQITGSMTSNDEVYPAGTQWGCSSYTIYFSNLPTNCPSFEVRVWIYG